MGGLSPIHWLIVLGVGAVVFGGRGKLSSIMGDAAKGIRAFKDGLKDEHGTATTPAVAQPVQITAPPIVSPTVASPTVAAAPVVEREDIAR